MPGERAFVFTLIAFPQINGLVPPPPVTRKRFSIRTECYAFNPRRMPGKGPLMSTCDSIPQTDSIVITSTGERPSIRD